MPYLISDHECYCGDSRYYGKKGVWNGKCPGRNYNTWPDNEFYNCPRNWPQNMTAFARVGIDQQPETD